jgi:peptidoglycan/xylan/chitin deacetylase (PgdA/CDA1 family)
MFFERLRNFEKVVFTFMHKLRNLLLVLTIALFWYAFHAPQEGTAQALVIARGDISTKNVALTIDDGPHPGFTNRILDILQEKGVKATFFVVGRMAAVSPEIVRRMLAEGHTVGNHTHYHNNLLSLPSENVHIEWDMCSSTLKTITGKTPRFARPPGGNYDASILQVAQKSGLTTVLWTANGADCTGISSGDITKRILSRTGPGGIILLHSGVEATIEALPGIIDTLKTKGYRFVTLDEMAGPVPAPQRKELRSASSESPKRTD